jgi:chromosomal replication initiation ATPase DnaA
MLTMKAQYSLGNAESYFREHLRVGDYYAGIRQALERKNRQRENYLIWAPPGSGKTSFVTEIANVMGVNFAKEQFFPLNLSELPQDRMVTALKEIEQKATRPLLCMIDEIDSRSSEVWPYEEIFSCLDWNTREDHHIVFVLAGSGGKGLNGMIGAMRARPRGADLIDRIPEARRFEIPVSDDEDRLVIFAKQALLAAAARNQELHEIERLAMYYVLKSELLSTPRQLTEFAKAAVARMELADNRLLYDHLFRLGDRQRMEFWSRNLDATKFQGSFLWISE